MTEIATPRVIDLVPDRYDEPDKWESPMILRVRCGYTRQVERLSPYYVGPNGTCRRDYDGPVLPGPYPYLVANSFVIDNYGGTGAESARMRAAGLEFDAQVGDRFLLNGLEFVLRDDRPRTSYPDLCLVADNPLGYIPYWVRPNERNGEPCQGCGEPLYAGTWGWWTLAHDYPQDHKHEPAKS